MLVVRVLWSVVLWSVVCGLVVSGPVVLLSHRPISALLLSQFLLFGCSLTLGFKLSHRCPFQHFSISVFQLFPQCFPNCSSSLTPVQLRLRHAARDVA